MRIRKRRRLLKNEFGSTLEDRSKQVFGLKSNDGLQADSGREEVRVFAMDEARFGLKTWNRRRWCPKGHRPPWTQKQKYQWLWLYAAVEPATGESFCMEMSYVDGDCFETFLWEMKKAYPEDPIVLVFDRAGSHRSGRPGGPVEWPRFFFRLGARSSIRSSGGLRNCAADFLTESSNPLKRFKRPSKRHFGPTGRTKPCFNASPDTDGGWRPSPHPDIEPAK